MKTNKQYVISELHSLKVEIDTLGKTMFNEGMRLGKIKGLEDHEKRTLGFNFLDSLKNKGGAFSRINIMLKNLGWRKVE